MGFIVSCFMGVFALLEKRRALCNLDLYKVIMFVGNGLLELFLLKSPL